VHAEKEGEWEVFPIRGKGEWKGSDKGSKAESTVRVKYGGGRRGEKASTKVVCGSAIIHQKERLKVVGVNLHQFIKGTGGQATNPR